MRIALTVNGRPVEADLPPRTSLADLLRDHLLLTGTHLGCEHGICGACTVAIDGEIARSCITYAVACDGAEVRTIEGFDDDPLMARLRRAFTEAHALQCGYCTPGMLIAARDLVRRKSGLSRQAIRFEMSGNLCRCTGYAGIIDAIARVMTEEAAGGQTPGAAGADRGMGGGRGSDPVRSARWLGPAPGPLAGDSMKRAEPAPQTLASRDAARAPQQLAPAPQSVRAPVRVTTGGIEERGGATHISQSFVLDHAREAVWALMSDPEAVVVCMPGARLDGPPQHGKVTGRIEVKLGPVVARFAGEGTITLFAAEYRQVIEGHGADRRSGSRVSGGVDYRLSACPGASGGEATRVDAVISYALTGLFAQIGRSGLARDLAQRIGEAFAQNIDARLRSPSGAAPQARLSALALIMAATRARLRAILARIMGG